MPKKLLLSIAFALLLLAAAAVGVEFLAWLFVPSWPGYMLRPRPISVEAVAQWHSGMPDIAFSTNRWQMRDRERSETKPPGVSFRSVFIGDSFLEGGFTRAALPSRIEGRLVDAGLTDIEAVNLGVAATSPVEYYYRIREVGLKLHPDAIVMMFFSGNDFVSNSFLSEPRIPPLVDELPRPSLLAAVAPHTTWLAAQAIVSPGAGSGKYIPGESELIADALRRPRAERLAILSRHMREHYFPQLDERTIHEILARGDDRFWSEYAPRRFDREYLQAWVINGLISLEASETQVPLSPAEATAGVDAREIDSTLSWIVAADRLAKARGVKFLVALIPMPAVDPAFAEYWRPWPRYYSYNLQGDARHQALATALSRTEVAFVDLRQELDGVRGAYRKTDMHWTEHGHEVVAARLAKEVVKLKP